MHCHVIRNLSKATIREEKIAVNAVIATRISKPTQDVDTHFEKKKISLLCHTNVGDFSYGLMLFSCCCCMLYGVVCYVRCTNVQCRVAWKIQWMITCITHCDFEPPSEYKRNGYMYVVTASCFNTINTYTEAPKPISIGSHT